MSDSCLAGCKKITCFQNSGKLITWQTYGSLRLTEGGTQFRPKFRDNDLKGNEKRQYIW